MTPFVVSILAKINLRSDLMLCVNPFYSDDEVNYDVPPRTNPSREICFNECKECQGHECRYCDAFETWFENGKYRKYDEVY